MKRSQIILFTVFLVLSALIYFALKSNRKEYSKEIKKEVTSLFIPVREVTNSKRKLSLTSYGQIEPNREIIISFEVQGKLEKGEVILKAGSSFKQGQILYRVNNEEAFYALNARKSSLANLLIAALPDIELDYPAQKEKWLQFLSNITPMYRLPELPSISSQKERMFLTTRNILTEYFNLKSQEARMEKYVFVAPFNGTVLEVYAEPGSVANPGGQIAKIAQINEFEVKVPISLEDLAFFKEKSEANFTDASGKSIGIGSIIRVSDVINRQTQSNDVYYSIQAEKEVKLYSGMYVNVSINKSTTKESVTLPRLAVKNNMVQVLKGKKVYKHPVYIVGSVPDSIIVTGLENGEKVVLEPVETIEEKIEYKGIIR